MEGLTTSQHTFAAEEQEARPQLFTRSAVTRRASS